MFKKNAGITKEETCQNQFTAYILLAAKRTKWAYVRRTEREKEKQLLLKEKLEKVSRQTEDVTFPSNGIFKNQRLEDALEKLSKRERCVIIWYLLEAQSFKEIGETLHISPKGAASIYYRARKKIRTEMEDTV